MTAWTDFLASRGAAFDHDAVVGFGDPAGELAAARDRAVVCDLSPLGVLSVAGPDAAQFLHGQVTSDVLSLSPGRSQFSAWCSAKGRMLANFLIRCVDEQRFELLLPGMLVEPVRKRLGMFVLRSKVHLDDASAASVRMGVGGRDASSAVHRAFGEVPSLHRSLPVGGGSVVALPGALFIAFLLPQHAASTWDRLASSARPAGFACWQWLTIGAGVPIITPPTADQFVPQAANWDVLDGVGFHKGCYSGQEIVARMQYLGRLKERLVLGHVEGSPPAAGERLFSAAFGDQACGSIVNAAAAPDGGADLLAVLQLAARDSGDVRVGARDGRALALRPLPYPVAASSPPRGRSG